MPKIDFNKAIKIFDNRKKYLYKKCEKLTPLYGTNNYALEEIDAIDFLFNRISKLKDENIALKKQLDQRVLKVNPVDSKLTT